MDGSITHIRPRFSFIKEVSTEAFLTRLRKLLDESPDHIRGRIVDSHVTIDIVGDPSHFWSPHLDFRVESIEDSPDTTLISGLIGPSPGVWTLFVFLYFIIALVGFVFFSIGVSKWMMNQEYAYFWSLPITIILMATAYKAGKLGEQLGVHQIAELKNLLHSAIH